MTDALLFVLVVGAVTLALASMSRPSLVGCNGGSGDDQRHRDSVKLTSQEENHNEQHSLL
jgi:hypothetical protein